MTTTTKRTRTAKTPAARSTRAKAKPALINFAPALTWEQIENHEARTDIGVQRRLTLATLTKSGPELLAGFCAADDNGDTLIAAVEQIGAHRDYLKACVELADAAYARLLIVADAIDKRDG